MAFAVTEGPHRDVTGTRARFRGKYTFTDVTSGTLSVPLTNIETYFVEEYSGTKPAVSLSGTTFTFSGATSGAVIYIEAIGKR